jgi:hypothetical protein
LPEFVISLRNVYFHLNTLNILNVFIRIQRIDDCVLRYKETAAAVGALLCKPHPGRIKQLKRPNSFPPRLFGSKRKMFVTANSHNIEKKRIIK